MSFRRCRACYAHSLLVFPPPLSSFGNTLFVHWGAEYLRAIIFPRRVSLFALFRDVRGWLSLIAAIAVVRKFLCARHSRALQHLSRLIVDKSHREQYRRAYCNSSWMPVAAAVFDRINTHVLAKNVGWKYTSNFILFFFSWL